MAAAGPAASPPPVPTELNARPFLGLVYPGEMAVVIKFFRWICKVAAG